MDILKWFRMMIIVFFLISIFPIQSYALDCVEIEPPVIDHFDMAVVGTVLNVKHNEFQQFYKGVSDPKQYVLLEVEESWKQQVDSQMIFEADYAWSYPFEKGQKYLIYLNENNGKYINNPCSPVEEASASNYEVTFGEGFVPKNEVNISYKMWLIPDKTFKSTSAGIILLILSIFIWQWFKRRKNR